MIHGQTCQCCISVAQPAQSLDELDFERSIFGAALSGNVDRVVSLLRKNPECVHSQQESGYTPLHFAARAGHVEVVNILLSHGANPNCRTRAGGATPLHRACFTGSKACVVSLLRAGADATIKDGDGQTALDKARARGHNEIAKLIAS